MTDDYSIDMPILLTHKLDRHSSIVTTDRLLLTAEERSRSRHPHTTESGVEVYLQLKRGTVLQQGDRLQSDDGSIAVEIVARAERVMVVTAAGELDLLQAAYHLGNRHVPLEISQTHLYLLPDPVLRDLLEQRGLQVAEADRPFQPETGAYETASDRHHHHHH